RNFCRARARLDQWAGGSRLGCASPARILARRARQAPGELAHVFAQLRWIAYLELDVEQGDVQPEAGERMAAGLEQAALVIDALEAAGEGGDALGHALERCMEQHARLVGVDVARDRARDVGGDVAVRHWARHEAPPRRGLARDAIDAKAAPVAAVQIPGHQVPAPARMHEPVRLDLALARVRPYVGVAEGELLLVAASAGELGQECWIDLGPRAMD